MADKKISELIPGSPSLDSVIPASNSSGTITNKITLQSILDLESRWDLFKPAAPSNITAFAGNGQATISWTAPASLLEITDYILQYSSNSGLSWTTFSDSISNSTTITVTGLVNNTEYLFKVATINQIGTGSYSTEVSATPNPQISVAYLLVGGGGGGGSERGAGGGAGGYLYNSSDNFITGSPISIIIGNGGSGGNWSNGTNGENTIISQGSKIVSAYGGGYGARGLGGLNGMGAVPGGSGGSGGGGTGYNPIGSGGSATQGYPGGAGYGSGEPYNGGGGGGAGGTGGSGQASNAAGGIGKNTEAAFLTAASAGISINGSVYIAGGGGAGSYQSSAASGGLGGGGAGGETNVTGSSGTNGTGGGGGGGGNAANGGNGGSGIAIIRVEDSITALSTTGSPSMYTSNGYRYYKFIENGSITF